MKVPKRFSSLSVLFLLLISMFTVTFRLCMAAQVTPEATLTGKIIDHGVDTNGNGLYDYLEVDVEINVTVAGNFQVTISGLLDQSYNYISVGNASVGDLDVGIQYLNVSLPGPTIFSSRINPQTVNDITLYSGYVYLGYKSNIALSRVYAYTEFDPPGAILTGHITDRGVDIDHDGLFDYLEVGIEINVTESGQYQVSAEGLMEKTPYTNYLNDYEYEQGSFTVGVQTVHLNFSGPEIASMRFNPTHVYFIDLYDSSNNYMAGHLDSAPLSMRYNYTLFDAPSKNIQVNFKVYPDATVAVDGSLNFTHMYPENTYLPQVNATIGFSTSGNLTTETSSGTMVLPESSVNYSASEEHLHSSYSNGVANYTANSSTVFLPQVAGIYPYNTTDVSLNATYAGGLFDVAISGKTVIPNSYSAIYTTVPFNTSDITVLADFDGTAVTGNITFHAIGGFPFADVRVDFSGNRSSLSFVGNVNVTYLNYQGYEINETTLDQELNTISNMEGQGSDSLYNMTGGYLECTQVSLTKTPWSDPTLGADVTFSAAVNGSFTGGITYAMFPPGSPADYLRDFAHACLESAASSVRSASLTLNYYHSSGIAQIDMHLTSDVKGLCNSLISLVPPATPSPWSSYETEIEAWLKMANATAYAIEDTGFNSSYSSAEGKMSSKAWLLANGSELKSNILLFLPNAVPSSLYDLMESFANTTYCTLTSSTETFDMVNGIATFSSAETLQGDFEAELNRDKSCLLGAFSTLSSTPLSWDLRLLNETDININNFQADFKLGQDWMQASFSGLILKPKPDNIDPVRFELKDWLNLTNDPDAPPLEFDKLSVMVSGASNANQTVMLYQPSDVPNPDSLSRDYRSMAWNNASLSSLKDLMFLVASDRQISYNSKTYDVPIFTNSTVTSFSFDPSGKRITFNVTGPPGTGFCNVTIPKSLLSATSLSDWVVMLDGTPLTSKAFSITENPDYVFVYLNYTHSQHVISIVGTWLVTEFHPDTLSLILAMSTVVAVVVAVKRRRKQPLKAKDPQTLTCAVLSSRSRS